MAAAQVQALISMAEALHRIASALEERDDPENLPPLGGYHPRPARTANKSESDGSKK
ncbi:hypothetical protein BZB76_0443 [Actinomadura pelletieri DSM 43383]|uniref:Uncharacterized protein n=2 Tax=Actinomadura pelletieri TaxID=111805 RepID=A0A495QXT8_9ACTN|nr:hypothetical protein BZB76_0443 [Actinomadura pelletieri DSM 43383]